MLAAGKIGIFDSPLFVYPGLRSASVSSRFVKRAVLPRG